MLFLMFSPPVPQGVLAEAVRVYYEVPVIWEEEKEFLSNILKRKIAPSFLHVTAENKYSKQPSCRGSGKEGISFCGEEVLQQYYLKGKYLATIRPFSITRLVMQHTLWFFESQHLCVPQGDSSDL